MVKTPEWWEKDTLVGNILRPVIPLVANVVVSGGVFTAGMLVTQMLAKSCRISSATPILAPMMGFAGVGLAAAAAGQAVIYTQQRYGNEGYPGKRLIGKQRQHLPRQWQAEDLVLDAMVGILLFKMLGGRFRNTLPSDLFQRGSFALESLPATGPTYATEGTKQKLRLFMLRDGCHHCGRKHGKTVGDHIPPNKLVYGPNLEKIMASDTFKQLRKPLKHVPTQSPRLKARRRRLAGEHQFLNPGRWLKSQVQRMFRAPEAIQATQHYYPQCASCSQLQAAAVRNDRRTLILHFGGPRPWYLAGTGVGLRHFMSVPGGAAASLTKVALHHFGAVLKKTRQ